MSNNKSDLNDFVQEKTAKKNCQGRVDADVYNEARANIRKDPRFTDIGDLLEALLRRYNHEMKEE